MGILIYANGCPSDLYWRGTYGRFQYMMDRLTGEIYGKEMAEVNSRLRLVAALGANPDAADIEYYQTHAIDPLTNSLIYHSDCEGYLTPRQCRKLYQRLKNVHLSLRGDDAGLCSFEDFKRLLHWCGCHLRRLRFS